MPLYPVINGGMVTFKLPCDTDPLFGAYLWDLISSGDVVVTPCHGVATPLLRGFSGYEEGRVTYTLPGALVLLTPYLHHGFTVFLLDPYPSLTPGSPSRAAFWFSPLSRQLKLVSLSGH